jgi:hypothetical protein
VDVDQAVMDLLRRFLNGVRLLGRSESGMALPTAIFATVAAFGLASAAVVASVDTQRGTARDQNSKEAIAAADAGANIALLRLNRYASALTVGTPCLGVNSSKTLVLTTADASAPGWCPPVTGTVGTASYSYRVSAATASGSMAVVATGITPKASRRVAVSFKGTTIGGALSTDGLIGQDKITIAGNGEVHVNMGTNGTVETQGNHASACGDIRHGVGVALGKVNQCAGYKVTEGNVAMPAVSSFMPTDIATNNSNYRLATCTQTTPTKVPSGCQSDTITGLSWTNSPWNPKTRTISLSGKEPTLTLGGSDYFICKLEVTGGHLYMASESHVRIFFDEPKNCENTTEQVRIAGNGSIEATAFDEKAGVFDMPGLYLLGSTTTATQANFEGNGAANQFLLYAPNTAVRLAGNGASYAGAFVGKTIEVAGNGYVYQPAGYSPPPFGGSTLYARQAYVECTGATASPPNAGC